MSNDEHIDRLIDVLLAEVVGGETPPDLARSILARAFPEKRRLLKARRPLVLFAAAASIAAVFLLFWLMGERYPEPRAEGTYTVVDGSAARRGAVIQTAALPAAIFLGGYCRVEVEPESAVRIEGAPRAEQVFLLAGGIECEVTPEKGAFTVVSEAGKVSVTGTRFIVRMVEKGEEEMTARMFVKVLAGAVLVSGAWGQFALAGEQEGRTPGGRGQRGGVPGPEGGFQGMVSSAAQGIAAYGSQAAMIESGGKLYIVTGATLARVDVKTLAVEMRRDLSAVGRDPNAEAEDLARRKEFLARFDTDGDGAVAGEELERNRWLSRMDRNQDGKITVDEAPVASRPAPGAAGEVVLLAKDGVLYMLRGGFLFTFDLATLELKKSARLVEETPPQGQNVAPGGAAGGPFAPTPAGNVPRRDDMAF